MSVASAKTAHLPSRHWTVAVATGSAVVMTLDITIVNVALPSIGRDLQMSLGGAQWVVNAYTLAFAAFLLTAGSLTDRLGRRSIFAIGHIGFAVASATCALAGNEGLLIAGRGAQGVAAALVFGAVMPLVADCFGPEEGRARTGALGVVAAISGGAAAIGPLLGGWLVDLGNWRLVFAVNLPIGVLILVITAVAVPDRFRIARMGTESGSPPVDPTSVVLAVLGLLALNYAILTGPADGWTSTTVALALPVAGLALGAFGILQRRRGRLAMVDLSLFRIPSFAAISVMAFAVRVFSFGIYPFVILWLAGPAGLGPTQVGLVLLAMALPMLLTAIPAARLQRWFAVGHILGAGMVIAAIGLALGLLVSPGDAWSALIPTFVVLGIGAGLTFPYLMDVAVSVVPPSRAGTATGVANTAFPLGTSFGVAVFGAGITAEVRGALPDLPESAVSAATTGDFGPVAQTTPELVATADQALVSGLHTMFLVAMCFALVSAIVTTFGVREADRWHADAADAEPETTPPTDISAERTSR